jgi:hypothetical protein
MKVDLYADLQNLIGSGDDESKASSDGGCKAEHFVLECWMKDDSMLYVRLGILVLIGLLQIYVLYRIRMQISLAME